MHLLIWILVIFKTCHCYHTLLFNTPKDIRVAYLTKPKKTTIIVKDLQDSFALDFLYNDSLVCWTNHDVEQIDCVVFNSTYSGNKSTYVKNIVPRPEGLACDWLTRKLYWTDHESKRIEVVSLQTKYRKVLYWEYIDMPRGIVLDPLEGFMFWTDWTDPPKIERGSMDGDLSSRRTIISDENIYWPNSVTVDVSQQKLYWLDGKFLFIEVTDYNGKHRKKLAEKISEYPFALSFAFDRLYWTDWKSHSIYSYDHKSPNSNHEIIHLTDSAIVDVKFYNVSRQPYKWTPCEQNNGGCSHLCLRSSANPEKFSCACPTGIKLVDHKTCASKINKFILLAQLTEISRISLDTPDHSSAKLPLRNVRAAMGIDFDPVDEYFYWTDEELRNIHRANMDGSKQETIVSSEIQAPDGIAVDWLGRNIYWSDMLAGRIEVFRPATPVGYRKTIIFDDLMKPRAVVVSPEQSWLFWSDWDDSRPKIERSDLDGFNRIILVDNDISWPNALAVDYQSQRLYFGDAKTERIEVIDVDGGNRQKILSYDLPHIFAISVLGDHLYWTDWTHRSLQMVNKYSTQNRTTVLDNLVDVRAIKAVDRSAPLGTNACASNGEYCSQFCFSKPNKKYSCSCQDDYELSRDNRTCVTADAYLLISDNNYIYRLSIHTFNEVIVAIPGIKSLSAIDVDMNTKRVYWADNMTKAIYSAFLNGSRIDRVLSIGLVAPESLAVDWISSNLYWADTGYQRIEVARLDGQYRRTLFWINVHDPRHLVLDPSEGYMFWIEWNGVSGSVIKATMDGSSKRVLVNGNGRLNGLTIDYAHGYLYWIHDRLERSSVELCDSNGQNRRVIVSSTQQRPYLIAQNHEYLFWSYWNESLLTRANKHNGANPQKFRTQVGPILHMKMVNSSKQRGWNQCKANNGDCRYLCLASPGISSHMTEIRCTCPTHYVLMDDTCQSPNNFLLFSQRNAVSRMVANTIECPDAPLSITGLKGIRSIEYDSATRTVYSLEKNSTIKRFLENGTHSVILFPGSRDNYIYDIVLEPFNKLLFFSTREDTINVTRLNNSTVGCVFKSANDEKPYTLALHPEKGLLFWTLVGSNPRIVQSRLNGDNASVIDTDNRMVNAMTVDRRSNVLYFTLAGQIVQYNLAEKTRRYFFSVASKIVGLAAIQSLLYWVEKEGKDATSIKRGQITVNTLSERIPVVGMVNVTDLIAVDVMDDTYQSHPCSSANNHGNCSHLCLPSTVNFSMSECACPLSFNLSKDGRTCSSQPSSCGPDHFMCVPKNECIPNSWKCDGNLDCLGGSDEDNEQCFGGEEESMLSRTVYNQENVLKNDSYVEDVSTVVDGNIVLPTIALLIILVALVVAAVLYRFAKKCRQSETIGEHDFAALSPLAPDIVPQIYNSSTKSMPMTNGSASERNHITGGSSSTSMIHCPLNPPPSPTTTTMHQDECDCMPYPMFVPSPTTCSTGVYDDSDSAFQTEVLVTYRNGSRVSYHRRMNAEKNRYRSTRHSRHHRPEYRHDFNSAPLLVETPHLWSEPESVTTTPYAPPPTPINSPFLK